MPRKILDKEPLTLAEAKDVLSKRGEDSEMSYWQRVAYEHAMRNTPLEAEESRNIVEKLMNDFGLSELSAFSIANILPTTEEELKDLLQKEPKMLTETEIKEIYAFLFPYISRHSQ